MELLLKRIALKPTYTIGKLYIDDKYFCDTLEDTVRDVNRNGRFDGDEKKIYGDSAIPFGRYEVVVTYSPKFRRRLPRLINVPHFDGILIHRGNTSADTAGCILVGENKEVGKVLNSTKYEVELTKMLDNGEKHYIIIV